MQFLLQFLHFSLLLLQGYHDCKWHCPKLEIFASLTSCKHFSFVWAGKHCGGVCFSRIPDENSS